MKTLQKIALSACLVGASAIFGAAPAWAILPIQHWSEPSGAQVWLVDSPVIPMVDVQIRFDAGSRRDPAAQAGLSSAFAVMASKGVRADGNLPALDENQLGEAWADLGASFGAGSDDDGLRFSLRSLTDPALLQSAAHLAARQMAQPSWPEAVWARERARWSAGIKDSLTRPGVVAGNAFNDAIYGSHPYGQRTTPETLDRISVADFAQFAPRYMQACRARISVVGALNRAQTQDLVRSLLAQLPQNTDCAALPAVPPVPALSAAFEKKIPFDAAQAQIYIGQPSFARNDPDFLTLLVGNHILGGGGFVSRLMNEVREKRGLTYGISSGFAPSLSGGSFAIGLQTRPDQAEQALKLSREVLAKFIANGPTPAELAAAKDNLIGSFALRIDSNRKLLGNVANIAENGLPLDYLEHWTERVKAITVADIKAAMARKLQPERMVTIVLGAKEQ